MRYAGRMRLVWIGCFVLAMSGAVRAEEKKPGKDFWKILVAPKSKWVLHDPAAGNDPARKRATVTVETYDVRTIGKAQVARLRWTYKNDDGEVTFGGGLLQPTQVAVTHQGLYLLDEAMDDTAVAKALAKRPSRSSPPKPYKGTKRNGGRYLKVLGSDVCVGQARLAADGPCEDVCETQVCFSATKGVTEITGYDAPGDMIWTQ